VDPRSRDSKTGYADPVKAPAAPRTSASPDVLRVVIADDHPLILDGLASVIDADPGLRVVARATDGRTAIALCREHRPRVAVFDLQMPGLGGAEATELLLRSCPESAVIVLSVYGRDEDIHRCFQAGARGYLMKSSPGSEIVAAIRTVAAGKRYVPPDVGERLAGRMPCSELTSRENTVLQEIVRGKSNREIADGLGLRESTVKWHVNALLGKLGVEDRVQAVVHALRRGLARLDD
jgi:two-component system, NarL family, response regulator